MERRPLREGSDRFGKRRSHARPDRIIEKRPNWQDYLDPEEDPGLIDDEELLEANEQEGGEPSSDAHGSDDGRQPDEEDSD